MAISKIAEFLCKNCQAWPTYECEQVGKPAEGVGARGAVSDR